MPGVTGGGPAVPPEPCPVSQPGVPGVPLSPARCHSRGSRGSRGPPDPCPVSQAGVPGGAPLADGAGGSGRVRALQQEVQGVTTIMSQNLERILARGENLEQLHSKSQDLEATSEHFRTTSQKMARRYWWKNVKLLIILGLVGVIVLILIILLATGTIPT
uniref:V-SNARE coiled-coil homology domain-containing protein n=3 Tax=Passeriformes TaxID=9126 RepID=A0A8C3NEC5_GEOPR